MQHCWAPFPQHTLGQACIYTNYISRDLIWLQIVPEINGAHSAVRYWNKAKTTKNPNQTTQENWTAAVRVTVSELPLHFARHMSLCRCICDHFFKGRAGNSGSLTQSLVLPQWLTPRGAEGHRSSPAGLGSAVTHLKNTHLQPSVWFFVSFPRYHFSVLLNPRAFR